MLAAIQAVTKLLTRFPALGPLMVDLFKAVLQSKSAHEAEQRVRYATAAAAADTAVLEALNSKR
jgi:hypothetical protein